MFLCVFCLKQWEDGCGDAKQKKKRSVAREGIVLKVKKKRLKAREGRKDKRKKESIR